MDKRGLCLTSLEKHTRLAITCSWDITLPAVRHDDGDGRIEKALLSRDGPVSQWSLYVFLGGQVHSLDFR